MCVNRKVVVNPYTQQKLVVDCGKCPSCLQAKANKRTSRINNTCSDDTLTLFVTLTYSNDFLPYFRKSDIEQGKFIIYRANTVRYCRPKGVSRSSTYVSKPIVQNVETVLSDCSGQIDFTSLSDLENLPTPTNIDDLDKVSCVYYQDVQLFFKRLRHVLQRDYNYNQSFKYFSCSEYGSLSKRPHFHLLLHISPTALLTFKNAIAKAWPFCSKYVLARSIEVARHAASYVSSYVNCSQTLQPFFEQSLLRQKHSYSKGYGIGRKDFRFPNVVKAIERRNLTYVQERNVQGVREFVTVPLPKYVLSRYFPTFKGIRKLTDSEIYNIILAPQTISCYAKRLQLDDKQIHSISTMLKNKVAFASKHSLKYGSEVCPIGAFEYAHLYITARNLYKSQTYIGMFDDVIQTDSHSMLQLYDNLNLYHHSLWRVAPTLEPLIEKDTNFTFDSNLYDCNLFRTKFLTDSYYRKSKTKEFNSKVYSQIAPNFLI